MCRAGRTGSSSRSTPTEPPRAQAASLLGGPGRALHRELTTRYNDGVRWKLHYVTAREMYNVVLAALSGCSGDPHAFRNYRLRPPPL
jgi:hypothetical protein